MLNYKIYSPYYLEYVNVKSKFAYKTFNRMKNIIGYIAATILVAIGMVLLCFGSVWFALCGLCWFGMLYVSSEVCPNFWRNYWRINMSILARF